LFKKLERGKKMLAPTHGVFGLFVTLIILAVFGVQSSLHISVLFSGVLGSLMPDIDLPRSTLGRLFPFISKPLERHFGHRTITHSFLGWAIGTMIAMAISVAVSFLIPNNQASLTGIFRYPLAFSMGYLSHLLLDMMNPTGVPLFWPNPGYDVFPKNPKLRPAAGSFAEAVIFIVLLFLLIPAFPLSKYGINSCLHWLLATPQAAIEEFKTLKTTAYVQFKGVDQRTHQSVSGKALLLDVVQKHLIVWFEGQVRTLGDDLAADITTSQIRILKTAQPIAVQHHTFVNQPRKSLLNRVSQNALISGTVQLPPHAQIKIIDERLGDTIQQKGETLVLTYASPAQLQALTFDSDYTLNLKKNLNQRQALKIQIQKIRYQIAQLQSASRSDLTPLGQKLLGDSEKSQLKTLQLMTLQSDLQDRTLQLATLEDEIASQQLLFSGAVNIRTDGS
jgi:inner membrane protein